MSKPKPKNIPIAPPPEAQERVEPADRAALSEASLQLQVAQQQAQLASIAVRDAEQRLRQVEAKMTARYKLGQHDKVHVGTGQILRAPAPPAEAAK